MRGTLTRDAAADLVVGLALLTLVAAGIYQLFVPVLRLIQSQPLR